VEVLECYVKCSNGAVFAYKRVSAKFDFFGIPVVVHNCANVGSISGLGLVFVSIVQFDGNITGAYITLGKLLLEMYWLV
jgi:hypothetical protein